MSELPPRALAPQYKTRLLLVCEHALLREGIQRLLSDFTDAEVVGAADSVERALDAVDTARPDVIVTESTFCNGSALHLARRARERLPSVRIVMLLLDPEEDGVLEAANSGIMGMLDRDAGAERLIACIREVSCGQFSISERLASQLLSAASNRDLTSHSRMSNRLTNREFEVLALISGGLTNRAIASRLYLSESSVRAHLRSIMQKLGVQNRVQAAAFALRNGISPLQETEDLSVAG